MKCLILLLLLSPLTYAEEYKVYNKVGISYILDQPSKHTLYPSGYKIKLYEGENISYHIERGIKIGNYNFGLAWNDILKQGSSKSTHRPYKLEVFGDHYWKFKYLDIKLGTGFKLFEDRDINYTIDGIDYVYDQYGDGGAFQARFTTRFSVGKTIGNYEIALGHHSQWLQGKPINDKFEYHKTELSISYIF